MIYKRIQRFSSVINRVYLKDKSILSLEINSIHNHNALSKKLIDDLEDNIDFINSEKESKDLRFVVLKSNHAKIFCAGADLKERKDMNEDQVKDFVTRLRTVFYKFSLIPVPSVACINGFALGGGLELANSCDFRFATKKAVLGLTETSLGIIPGAGGTQTLQRIIGISKAKELIYTAEKIDAQRGYDIGLVNRLFDTEEDMIKNAVEMGEKISNNGPLAVKMAKKALNDGNGLPLSEALKVEEAKYYRVLKSNDRIEGLKAFIEKRKPNFTGN